MKLFICTLLFLTNTYAKEIAGINFPDTITAQKKTLKLNGVGLREATFLKIKVYAGALYVENHSQDGLALAKSKESKILKMNFIRDVEAKKIKEAFKEGYEKNCDELCGGNKQHLEKLLAKVEDLNKGDTMELRFNGRNLEFVKNDQVKETFDSKEFSEIILKIYVGNNPPNESLKKGLLGL